MKKYYLVYSKCDDYGHCRRELTFTTKGIAEQYYKFKEVTEYDAQVLRKYFDVVLEDEEKQRTPEQRFYGVDE